LWRLSPSQFGDNPGQVPFAKHARPFQWLAWLQRFFKIDLVKGYHQIPVAAADIPKTVIIMPFGSFEFLFTPFGLSNAAQTFQIMMDRTTEGLEGVFVYMDSRVGSPDRQTHLRHLEVFFNALITNGLTIKLEKCVFEVPSLEILDHVISAAGAAPMAGHATKIQLCPSLQDIKQLQCFLSMVNFYHRFLPNYIQVLRPLTDLLRGGQNIRLDCLGTGGIPECKMPPGSGGAPLTPRPKC
jgi:hypothetical protein